MSIELKHVAKTFGTRPLFHDLSFKVEQGELHALVGPSGEGKSTLLGLIAGLHAPDAGDVLINGECVNRLGPQRRKVGYVFQDYALFPHLSAFENVAYGLRASGVERRRVHEKSLHYLNLVNLNRERDKLPQELSGGQKQRVALARALATEPSILLLDEPLSHLDAEIREQLQFELKELQRKTGVTMLLVTHNMTEAVTLGRRVSFLRHGRIERTVSTNALV
ncbi:MAG: hypothetical protein C0622_08870 [Desulfuromonas sp.]|nr:MAG: hypothetical protein C0622_08870 [Desulfuromonas sp.]